MGQISVVHVNTPPSANAVRFYCGRATSYQTKHGMDCSVLGNPFILKREADRENVCNAFKQHLEQKVRAKDPAVTKALNLIYKTARTQAVELSCFCAPKRCHADAIKELIEAQP